MKKILAILLTLTLLVGLVACGGSSSNSKPEVDPDAQKVADYVDKNRSVLLSTMEESFATSSGLTCTSSIKAEGRGIVIDININELSNVDADTKAQLQAAYDSMDSYWDTMFDELQKELPELDYFVINVNEKDGTNLATIRAD